MIACLCPVITQTFITDPPRGSAPLSLPGEIPQGSGSSSARWNGEREPSAEKPEANAAALPRS